MYDELVKRLRELHPEEFGDAWDFAFACQQAMHEAADAIEELIAALTASNTVIANSKPHWIPVTERCPEKSGDYLVFDDCRNLYVNEWHCLLKKWQYDDSRITHWMPLPEPPKEET